MTKIVLQIVTYGLNHDKKTTVNLSSEWFNQNTLAFLCSLFYFNITCIETLYRQTKPAHISAANLIWKRLIMSRIWFAIYKNTKTHTICSSREPYHLFISIEKNATSQMASVNSNAKRSQWKLQIYYCTERKQCTTASLMMVSFV